MVIVSPTQIDVRREFLKADAGAAATSVLTSGVDATTAQNGQSVQEFHAARRYLETRIRRIAYAERGAGPQALILHE